MRRGAFLFVLFGFLSSFGFSAKPVYFLVADPDGVYPDSYVLPLTDPSDISHARDLVENGPAAGMPLVVAHIVCTADGINRDYLSSTMHQWYWHITEFLGFTGITPEILDGGPTWVNAKCEWWCTNTNSTIGFWNYTVVKELGTCPRHWQANLVYDSSINLADYVPLAQNWLRSDCGDPDWCSLADINRDSKVDPNDLDCYAQAFLSPYRFEPWWDSCWECPYQCHGDADCQAEGSFNRYRVGNGDLEIYMSVQLVQCAPGYTPWPATCFDCNYNPCVDFDRDCDVDDADGNILETWLMKTNVPADCPITP